MRGNARQQRLNVTDPGTTPIGGFYFYLHTSSPTSTHPVSNASTADHFNASRARSIVSSTPYVKPGCLLLWAWQ